MNGKLTIFANFRIDSLERLQRMKDSYESFSAANIEKWVLNIRGECKWLAREFLEAKIKDPFVISHHESRKGWFHDSRQMIGDLTSPYVLFWIEDHINVVSCEILNQFVDEMHSRKVDYLKYSWFVTATSVQSTDELIYEDSEVMRIVNYSYDQCRTHQGWFKSRELRPPYIISAVSILSLSLFQRIILINDPRLRRHSRYTPFDFEKSSVDFHWLPLVVGVPKFELFACIDNDHAGPSLISRGLYPDRGDEQKSLNQGTGLTSFASYIIRLQRSEDSILRKLFYLVERFSFHMPKR